jgi:hypothetical protein
MAEPGEVTRLLQELTAGRTGAIDDLLPLVYAEMRRIAARHMRREGERTHAKAWLGLELGGPGAR